jgi:hypothetical protein
MKYFSSKYSAIEYANLLQDKLHQEYIVIRDRNVNLFAVVTLDVFDHLIDTQYDMEVIYE